MSRLAMFATSSNLVLLLCCLCASGQHVSIGASPLVALSKKVTEELSKSILTELQNVNESISQIQPAVETCYNSIQSLRIECGQCMGTSCQQRVDDLSCPSVSIQPVSECAVSPALCLVKETVARAKTAVKDIETEMKHIVEKVIGVVADIIKDGAKIADAVNKSIGQGVNTVKDGLENVGAELQKTGDAVKNAAEKVAAEAEKAAQAVAAGVKDAANTVKNIAESVSQDVAKTAKNIASEVEDAAKDASKVVAEGVKDAVNTVKDGLDKVKDILGIRIRRLANQPSCDQLSQDQGACLFYKAWCQKCDVFGTVTAPSTFPELITGVCGSTLSEDYQRLGSLLSKLNSLIGIAEQFSLIDVNFNPGLLVDNLYPDVVINFGVGLVNHTINAAAPLLPFDAASSGPAIAKDIFNKLFN